MPNPVSSQRQVVGPVVKADTTTKVEAFVQPHESRLALPSNKEMAILVWLTGSSLFLLWIGSRAIRYHLWLHRRRTPVPSALAQEFQELFAGFRFRKSPRIWLAGDTAQPFVWGLFRGSVYLPADFTSVDNPQHHRTVLVHELSHVARFDSAVNLIQILTQAIFWFHPFVWWVNKKIRQEREKCCDEMTVAQLSTAPEHYADAIVEALAAERRSAHPIPSLAIVGSVKDIEERIKTMLKPGKRFYRRPSVVVAMIVLALALITVPTALVLTVRAATEMNMAPPHRAASSGHIADVEQWLAQGGDVNVKNPAGETLLHSALLGERLDIIKLLEKHGADIDAEIHNDPSLIRQVAINGSPLVADYLISRGADTSHISVAAYLGKLDQVKEYIESGSQQVSWQDKQSILLGAITGGHVDIIEYILDHGADIKRWGTLNTAVRANRKHILELLIDKGADPNPGGGWSPLHITLAYYPRLEMAKALLSHGADPCKEKGENAWNPMHYAIGIEKKDMVKLFLEHRHNTDLLPYAYYALKNNRKDVLPLFEPYVKISPIHLSCFYGKLDDVKSYLGQGNDIEAQDIEGLSLLQCAVLGSQMEIVDYLIAQGCNVNSKASNGASALHYAANGNGRGKEMVQRLIAAGAHVEAKDNDDCTPFFYAYDLEAAQVLLKHGADINSQRKSDGATALHVSASRSPYNDMKRMRWLIAQGADVNIRKNDGLTPLGVAIKRDRLDALKYLVEHGADINCRDEDGRTPLHYAAIMGRKEIAEILINKGADINSLDNDDGTPLHYAACVGRKEIAELLIQNGANVNIQTQSGSGWTPLVLACQYGKKEIVELLLANGAEINVKNNAGITALDIASQRKYTEIVELLKKHGAKE